MHLRPSKKTITTPCLPRRPESWPKPEERTCKMWSVGSETLLAVENNTRFIPLCYSTSDLDN